DPTAVTLEQVEATPIRCPVPEKAAAMIELIDAVRKDRDSIGGVCEMVAVGVPPGLGEPIFDKLKADLGKALLSLPAVTAFEYGAGFGVATMRGSENNDVFVPGERAAPELAPPGAADMSPDCNEAMWKPAHAPNIRTETNRHGGMLGGISSGLPIVCRVAIKPTSSIPRAQRTVTRSGEPTEILVKGRHDPCLLPRFVPMGEAMIALVLIDHLLRAKCSKLGK
ncbi:MAG: chorismate synthase, partial [Gemmataceae bacterium]